jgi:hypothetical protein
MQQSSGTSENPAAAPMHMGMTNYDDWMLMWHGNAFISQVVQTGSRGYDQFFSTNWVMGMAQLPLAGGQFLLRTMISLEPLTVGKRGYPELFQSGEGLIDRQHPHDLFMELAAEYAIDIGHKTVAYIYAAPVGDPALGPTAFPHRVSAAELPQAPLAHHLQDSTHIASSVLTIGAKQKQFGVAISGFHGREPDENRWDLDKGSLDSWSVRGTWDPTPNWTAQLSTGHLDNPEVDEPGDVQRTTASVTHFTARPDGDWSSSVIWGWNRRSDGNTSGLLAESVLRFNVSNYVTGRLEILKKDHFEGTIKALTAGYTKDLFRTDELLGGVGGNVTFYDHRGDRPLSFYVFARLRSAATHSGH